MTNRNRIWLILTAALLAACSGSGVRAPSGTGVKPETCAQRASENGESCVPKHFERSVSL
jgi:hypothetical protein